MNFQNNLYTVLAPGADSDAVSVHHDAVSGPSGAHAGSAQSDCSRSGSAACAGAEFTIRLNPEHKIYRAHFPGDPITPGVCIIQIGLELLGLALGCGLELCRVKNVKFLSILRPAGVPVTVSIRKITEEGVSGGVSGGNSAGVSAKTPGIIPESLSEGVPQASSGIVSAQLEFSRPGEPIAKMSLICRKRPVAGGSGAGIRAAGSPEPVASAAAEHNI